MTMTITDEALEQIRQIMGREKAEPVAWRWQYKNEGRWFHEDREPRNRINPNWPHEIQPLYAAPPPAQGVREWQPIETAPKDGTEIILLFKHAVSARWLDNEPGYSGAGWVTLESREGFYFAHAPRAWMPLPEPPALQPKGQS